MQTNTASVEEYLTGQIALCRRRRAWRRFGCTLASLAAATWLLVGVLFEIEIIRGDSMNESFHSGDWALCWRLSSEYQPGDVVVLRDLADSDYIKRIIGLPGDTISLDVRTGYLYRNGKYIDEPYAKGKTLPRTEEIAFPLTLGEDEYFVLGDNREISVDSRVFGPVDEEKIKGRILLPKR